MQIGSARPCQTGAQGPASQAVSHARRSLDTTNAATNAATALRECLAGSKTGDALQPAMTDAPRYSSQQSPSLQPSYSGYES